MAEPVARADAPSFDFPTFMSALGRSAFAGGLGGLAGGVAAGVAIRLAMRVVAVLDHGATGRLTANGAVVGTITVDGSIFLVIFGAIFGLFLGSVMVVAFAWLIPGGALVRGLLFGLAMLLVFGSGLVTGHNEDFVLLASPAADVLLFSAPFLIAGFVAIVVDTSIERHLPAAGTGRQVDQGYVIVGALAFVLVGLTLLGLLGNISGPPTLLLTYAVVLGYGLIRHAATGTRVRTAGRLLLIALCCLGGAQYLGEVAAILGGATPAG